MNRRRAVGAAPHRRLVILWLVLVTLALTLAAPMQADEKAVAAWIESVGGHYRRSEAGAITSVDLRNAWITDTDLERLAGLPKLADINLAYTKITDAGLEHLAPLESVRVLNLHYAENVTDLGIAHVKHWRNLEYLNVRGTQVTSTLFEHVSAMTKLKSLDVSHSGVNDDLFEHLARLENLEHFAFGGNKMSGVALPLLKTLPALRELNISGQQRTDSGLWSVAVTDLNIDHIAQLERLEVLDLGATGVSDRGIAKLARLKNLHTLDLRGTRVSSKGIASLASLPQLRHLKLWQAEGIDDTAIPYFLKMAKLEVLELPETKVTATGIEQLAQKKNLKQLYLGGLSLTPEQVDAARKALPDCQITWWEKPKIEGPAPRRRRGN